MNQIDHTRLAPVPAEKLSVQIVDTFPKFKALRPEWETLYQQDPESTVFLSWPWLAEAFQENPYRWSIVVLRRPKPGGELIAALPLKYRVHWSQSRQAFQTRIEAGGRLLWSEYSGFLCHPRHEPNAIPTLARVLTRMPWSRMSLRYVLQQRRARLFTDQFAAADFSVKYKDYWINGGETNNLLCPQVDLPDRFDAYLATQVSANKRQKYNRNKRKYLETGAYTIAETTADSFPKDVDRLLKLWLQKWVPSKGATRAKSVARNYFQVLDAARKTGALYMPVLRRGDEILGALGHVRDDKNGVLHYVIAGRDVATDVPFVGSALHFHSIEWAIRNEYICYDFCHGNESFKYGYGAEDSEALYFEIKRRSRDAELAFDPINMGEALRRTGQMIDSGDHELASKACTQLSTLLS